MRVKLKLSKCKGNPKNITQFTDSVHEYNGLFLFEFD